MARYGQAFRDRIVARLLPPESAAIDVVSREVGVSAATLERWRAQALAAPGGLASSQRWTPSARLEAVITTAAMDEAARSAWRRKPTGRSMKVGLEARGLASHPAERPRSELPP